MKNGKIIIVLLFLSLLFVCPKVEAMRVKGDWRFRTYFMRDWRFQNEKKGILKIFENKRVVKIYGDGAIVKIYEKLNNFKNK